jgi:hypothetical protein
MQQRLALASEALSPALMAGGMVRPTSSILGAVALSRQHAVLLTAENRYGCIPLANGPHLWGKGEN